MTSQSQITVSNKVEVEALTYQARIAQIASYKVISYNGDITHEITQDHPDDVKAGISILHPIFKDGEYNCIDLINYKKEITAKICPIDIPVAKLQKLMGTRNPDIEHINIDTNEPSYQWSQCSTQVSEMIHVIDPNTNESMYCQQPSEFDDLMKRLNPIYDHVQTWKPTDTPQENPATCTRFNAVKPTLDANCEVCKDIKSSMVSGLLRNQPKLLPNDPKGFQIGGKDYLTYNIPMSQMLSQAIKGVICQFKLPSIFPDKSLSAEQQKAAYKTHFDTLNTSKVSDYAQKKIELQLQFLAKSRQHPETLEQIQQFLIFDQFVKIILASQLKEQFQEHGITSFKDDIFYQNETTNQQLINFKFKFGPPLPTKKGVRDAVLQIPASHGLVEKDEDTQVECLNGKFLHKFATIGDVLDYAKNTVMNLNIIAHKVTINKTDKTATIKYKLHQVELFNKVEIVSVVDPVKNAQIKQNQQHEAQSTAVIALPKQAYNRKSNVKIESGDYIQPKK